MSLDHVAARRRPRLAQALIDELRRQIETGVLGAGARLPTEPQLEARFAVSRTVVREAIAELRAAGLVTPIQGKGMFVSAEPAQVQLTPSELQTIPQTLEMLEFRIAVESEAAAIAAYRRSAQQEADIRHAHQALLGGMGSAAPTIEADFAFHAAVARATNNPYFLDALNRLGVRSIPRSQFPTLPDAEGRDYLTKVAAEHGHILDAIADQDPDAARRAMREHLAGSQKRYRSLAR